jgi:hypothetical protein
MAALQLGEEIREIHGGALPCFDMDIFATSAGDRCQQLNMECDARVSELAVAYLVTVSVL